MIPKSIRLHVLFAALTFITAISVFSYSNGVGESKPEINRKVSKKVKDYWFDGRAELSSYKFSQARYGELHEGTAILVYVTEPFSQSNFTKADEAREDNVSVLKLNTTKKFTTGIYSYSMMNSTFFPFEQGGASLKIASSLQEWCGMTYLEMKNDRQQYVFDFNSYFEGLSFKEKRVKKVPLEDDLWSLIRLSPESLPVGEIMMIPSLLFLRFRNEQVRPYQAEISLEFNPEGISLYKLNYPELDRTISIKFSTNFPYKILGWEERHYSGFGKDKKMLTSKAEFITSLKTDYWNQNLNEHRYWRDKLGLK